MNKPVVLIALAVLTFGTASGPARAQSTPPPAASAASTDPIYDDASVHFEPTKDWKRLPYTPGEGNGKLAPVAIYARNIGQENEQRMLLEMEPFEEPVDAWESTVENELRTQFDGALIRKQSDRLQNGMPAVWINLTYGSGFDTKKLYGYAVSDSRRGIFIAILGRLGMIDENESKKALSGLSVVVYPPWRR